MLLSALVPTGRSRRGRWAGITILTALLTSCASPAQPVPTTITRPSVIVADAAPGDDLSSLDVLDGLTQIGDSIGSRTAPVVLTVYSDVSCSACHQAGRGLITDLLAGPVSSGQLRIERKLFALGGVQPQSAALIAAAAAQQNRLFDFIQLYDRTIGEHHPVTIDDPLLQEILGAVPGVDIAAANAYAATVDARSLILHNTRDANELGLTAAPSYLIGTSTQTPIQIRPAGPTDTTLVLNAIAELAAGRSVTATGDALPNTQCAVSICTPP